MNQPLSLRFGRDIPNVLEKEQEGPQKTSGQSQVQQDGGGDPHAENLPERASRPPRGEESSGVVPRRVAKLVGLLGVWNSVGGHGICIALPMCSGYPSKVVTRSRFSPFLTRPGEPISGLTAGHSRRFAAR